MMSSEEIWKRAPSTVRPHDQTTNQQPPREASAASLPRGSSVTSNISDPSALNPEKFPPLGKSTRTVPIHDDLAATARSDDYTASTQSVMTPSMVSTHQKYQEFEQLFQRQQEFLQQGLSQSSNRLNDIETQLKQLRRIDDLEEKMSTSMKYHVATNTSLAAVKSQMDQMLEMMQQMNEDTRQQRLSRKKGKPTLRSSLSARVTQSSGQQPTLSPETEDMEPEYLVEKRNFSAMMGSNESQAGDSNECGAIDPDPTDTQPRSVQTAMDNLTITHNTADADMANSDSPSTSSHHVPTLTIHMNFEDEQSTQSLANTDLDDQYTYSSDPDGGDEG
jgi:hypothetical protein